MAEEIEGLEEIDGPIEITRVPPIADNEPQARPHTAGIESAAEISLLDPTASSDDSANDLRVGEFYFHQRDLESFPKLCKEIRRIEAWPNDKRAEKIKEHELESYYDNLFEAAPQKFEKFQFLAQQLQPAQTEELSLLHRVITYHRGLKEILSTHEKHGNFSEHRDEINLQVLKLREECSKLDASTSPSSIIVPAETSEKKPKKTTEEQKQASQIRDTQTKEIQADDLITEAQTKAEILESVQAGLLDALNALAFHDSSAEIEKLNNKLALELVDFYNHNNNHSDNRVQASWLKSFGNLLTEMRDFEKLDPEQTQDILDSQLRKLAGDMLSGFNNEEQKIWKIHFSNTSRGGELLSYQMQYKAAQNK